MITHEEYLKAKAIVDQYERDDFEEKQRAADDEVNEFDDWGEPCSVCGEVDGMVNPCCASYDPLHYKNCGYG